MNAVSVKFMLWAAVGALLMAGAVFAVGPRIWIPAGILAVTLLAAGARSMRFSFSFVAGLGLTLVIYGLAQTKHLPVSFLGLFVIISGTVGFAAFGPRTSHALPPEAIHAKPAGEAPGEAPTAGEPPTAEPDEA